MIGGAIAEADRATLDARLLAAHYAADGAALARLYAEAGARAEGDAAAFFLTHAYVFALEAGDARAGDLHARLVAMGREA
jgi:hypothetical protein